MSLPLLSFTTVGRHRIASIAYPNPGADLLPVVWVHGLTASLHFWEPAMYAAVRRQRQWYSISLPLHHPSTFDGEASADNIDESLLAELLGKPIDELLPTGRFHLVGYSLGAFACLNYAAKHPARVASVISIGGFMSGRARGLEGVLQFFAGGHFLRKAIFHTGWWVMQRHVYFLKLATLFYARRWRKLLQFPPLDRTLRAIFPDVQQHSISGQQALFHYLLDMDLMDEIDQIDTPVLVIAGEKDPIIPYDHQRACAERLVNGEFLSLPGVGHVAFGEAPEVFEPAVLSWLARYD